MYPSGGQSQPGGDQTANFFWLICLIAGVSIAVWWFARQYIVIPFFWLRIHEISIIYFFAQYWSPVAHFLHLPAPNLHELRNLQQYMRTENPHQISWNRFAAINTFIGNWSRYPICLVFIGLAIFLLFRSSNHFHQSYSMKTLRAVEQDVWPQIKPVVLIDLLKEDIDHGPWAMAQLPLHFCRQHDLLSVKVVANKKVWQLKQKPSFRLFALQLGPLWQGLDALPIHTKALAYIFLSRATGGRIEANRILKQIAMSASSGKLDFTDVAEKLKSFHNHRIIQWLEKRHAYVTTAMATLLEIARSDGVLASAEFLWLKPVDRRLWFVLNNVGRRTSVVEVSGVFSHWIAEKKVGRALKTPMVKGAVDALDESLQNILLVEESDQWRTISAD